MICSLYVRSGGFDRPTGPAMTCVNLPTTSNSAPANFLIDSSLSPLKSGGFGGGTGFATTAAQPRVKTTNDANNVRDMTMLPSTLRLLVFCYPIIAGKRLQSIVAARPQILWG